MDERAPRPSIWERLASFLLRPSAGRLALALAVAFGLATFALGFYADDWALIAVLEGRVRSHAGPFDLYRFSTGDVAEARSMIERGPWPWWTSPTLRLHLLRPLTSALFSLDHALFGLSPTGYHAHALLWWLVTVLAASAVLRRAVSPAAAALALLFFVVDDGHAQPIGWISSRHVLIAGAPALLGLAAHLRFRDAGWRPGRWLAPLGIAVGLSAGETALGGAALLFAYELVGTPVVVRREPLGRRMAAAAPTALVVASYVALYRALRCGASESGSYVEPFTEPLSFLAAVAVRLPILLGDLLASLPADFSNVAPRAPFVVLGLVATVGATSLAARAWPTLEPEERAAIRWLSLGAVLGAAIGLAGYPGSRVLLVPSVAGFGVVATLVDRALLRGEAPRLGRAARSGAVLFLVLHAVFAPLSFAVGVAVLARIARGTERVDRDLELLPPLPKRAYLLNASDPLGPFYANAIRAVRRPGDLHTFEILSMSKRTHRVTRTGPSTLRLETVGGTFLDGGFVDVFRARRLGLHAGDLVKLEGASVRVLADEAGAPTAIELALDVPFEDPSIALLAWDDGALRPVTLAPGEAREIPWSPGPTGLF